LTTKFTTTKIVPQKIAQKMEKVALCKIEISSGTTKRTNARKTNPM